MAQPTELWNFVWVSIPIPALSTWYAGYTVPAGKKLIISNFSTWATAQRYGFIGTTAPTGGFGLNAHFSTSDATISWGVRSTAVWAVMNAWDTIYVHWTQFAAASPVYLSGQLVDA